MSQLLALFKRTLLRDAGDYVMSRGFTPDKNHHEFYPFRRPGESSHELIELQFDKHGNPKVVVNFGVVPSEGIIDAYGRFVPAAKVDIAHLECHGRLFSAPYSSLWFQPRLLFGMRSHEGAVKKAVAHVINLFSQIERWFETERTGPNIRIYKNPWNAPGVRKKSMEERGAWPPDGWTHEDEEALRM